ncbi:hypothetical protein [Phocaeicola sp.]
MILLAVGVVTQAQVYEQAFVHTDKDCYLAGEDMWVKMLVTNEEGHPTFLSRVGYIEVCDTIHSRVQLKLALVEGKGWGKVRIPFSVPTGVYWLTGYTRYMRNGGEAAFFKKQIAIINTLNDSKPDRLKWSDRQERSVAEALPSTPITDREEYPTRSKVTIQLPALPDKVKDITLSVYRDETWVHLPFRYETGKKGGTYAKEWAPEYEGHIITGKIAPEDSSHLMIASAGFVGKNLCFTCGRKEADGKILFYTQGVSGAQELVIAGISSRHEAIHIDLLSPFNGSLSSQLPLLELYPDKQALVERSVGVQLQQLVQPDSGRYVSLPEHPYHFKPALSYDLDEYTRFPTMRETFLEFVRRLNFEHIDGRDVIRIWNVKSLSYGAGRSLMLLDGIPIYDHKKILDYDPYLLKRIDVFDGKYMFGGEVFDGVASFVSKKGRLSGLRLGEESQLTVYDFPHLKDAFSAPGYAAEENKSKPDFRHTLYWNPDVEPGSGVTEFYTSDLCGTFKVVVEAVGDDGELIRKESSFKVK